MNKGLAATLALLIGLAAGYAASKFITGAPGEGRATVITLTDAPQAGRCIATTADQHVRLKRGFFMLWRIENNCQYRQPGSRVELRFDPPGPFTTPTPSGENTIFEFVRQDPPPAYDTYPYKVWMIPSDGEPYEMEDPEVEIVWIL